LRKFSTLFIVDAVPDIQWVTDPDVLKALTHPLRRRIFRLLVQLGPATITLLAEHTGADPGQLSFHVRELAKRGFVEEVPELARDRRERWWRAKRGAWGWSSPFSDDPAAQAVADTADRLMVTEEFERLRAYAAGKDSFGPDWVEAACASNSHFRLTPAELSELTSELIDVLRRWSDVGRVDSARPDSRPDDGRESVFLFLHAFPERP
jgi:DNA-binding transcriptional ArsR family regulator